MSWLILVWICAGCSTDKLDKTADRVVGVLSKNDLPAFQSMAHPELLERKTHAEGFTTLAAAFRRLGTCSRKSRIGIYVQTSGVRQATYLLGCAKGAVKMLLTLKEGKVYKLSFQGRAFIQRVQLVAGSSSGALRVESFRWLRAGKPTPGPLRAGEQARFELQLFGLRRDSAGGWARVGLTAILGQALRDRPRLRVLDHRADRPDELLRLEGEPPLRINRAFAEAELRVVTGLIEPHFMAGFSGGRKGVFPALTELRSIERFHAYETLADPRADSGVLQGNPCHEIALAAARRVGVDLLLNAAITRDRRLAGVYCGDLEQAHAAGCAQVARWTTAELDGPADLVITTGGGYPLDLTLYQTVKGMVSALPALAPGSTLLIASGCGEGLGSAAYSELLLRWGRDWRGFLAHLRAHRDRTRLDQWELQMQCRVLQRIGVAGLRLVSDGIEPEVQRQLALSPVAGEGDARARAQRAVDEVAARRGGGSGPRIVVIPDGPYTMLRVAAEGEPWRGDLDARGS